MWTSLKALTDLFRSRAIAAPPPEWQNLNLSADRWRRASPMLRALFGYCFVDSFTGERTFGRATAKHVRQLKPDERELLLSLIRPRIHLKYVHVLDAVAALDDRESIPELRRLLEAERDLSRRLSIARALWELDRDSVFYDLLAEMTRVKKRRRSRGPH